MCYACARVGAADEASRVGNDPTGVHPDGDVVDLPTRDPRSTPTRLQVKSKVGVCDELLVTAATWTITGSRVVSVGEPHMCVHGMMVYERSPADSAVEMLLGIVAVEPLL